MTCPHCGADAPDGKKFCPACYRLVDSPLLKMKQELDALRAESSALRHPTLAQRAEQGHRQAPRAAHTLQHHVDIGAGTFQPPSFPEHPPHAPDTSSQTPAGGSIEARKERLRKKQRERQAAGGSHSSQTHRFDPTAASTHPPPTAAKAEAPAGPVPERFKRPAALTVYALLDLLAATALVRLAAGLHETFPEPRVPLIQYGIYALAALGVLCGLAGLGIWNMWRIGLVLQRLLILPFFFAPVMGTAYAIVTLVYLARPAVKVLFSGRSPRQLSAKEWKDVQASQKLSPVLAMLLFIFAWAPAVAAARFAVETLPPLLDRVSQTYPALGTLSSSAPGSADAPAVERGGAAASVDPEQAAFEDLGKMMQAQAGYAGLNAGLYDRVECIVTPRHCIRSDDGRNNAKLLDARFTRVERNGYVFQLRLSDPPESRPATASATGMGGYAYRAVPLSGRGKGFCGDQTGRVCTFAAEGITGDPLRCPDGCIEIAPPPPVSLP